jgi:hypothetical protein
VQYSLDKQRIYIAYFNSELTETHFSSYSPPNKDNLDHIHSLKKEFLSSLHSSATKGDSLELSDINENLFNKWKEATEDLLSPLTSSLQTGMSISFLYLFCAKLHFTTVSKNRYHVVLLLDSLLADLPFESLSMFEGSLSISRDFSIHYSYNRSKEVQKQKGLPKKKISCILLQLPISLFI